MFCKTSLSIYAMLQKNVITTQGHVQKIRIHLFWVKIGVFDSDFRQ